jgi:hypothetical protein
MFVSTDRPSCVQTVGATGSDVPEYAHACMRTHPSGELACRMGPVAHPVTQACALQIGLCEGSEPYKYPIHTSQETLPLHAAERSNRVAFVLDGLTHKNGFLLVSFLPLAITTPPLPHSLYHRLVHCIRTAMDTVLPHPQPLAWFGVSEPWHGVVEWGARVCLL